MTVALAWTRKVGLTQQLWFVSDSRLSGGRTIDYAPKILPLSRDDSAISFGGATDVAFPLMQQLALAVQHYPPARERALDIVQLKTHTLRVFQAVIDNGLFSDVKELEDPEASFILGGYSWRRKGFQLWEIRYNATEKRFEAEPARAPRYLDHPKRYTFSRAKDHLKNASSKVAFAGNMGKKARLLLEQLLTARQPEGGGAELAMEPFEVVRDMLRASGRYATIGGAPQLVRIDEHFRARPIGVYWPNAAAHQTTLLGRPALSYENLDVWVLDPDTLDVHHPRFAPLEPNELKSDEDG